MFESLAALIVEGFELDIHGCRVSNTGAKCQPIRKRPTLVIVSPDSEGNDRLSKKEADESKEIPSPLDGLLDTGLREIASKKEFKRFLELQGAPIKSLIKSSFNSFVENILPLEKTSNLLKTEGMDLKPAVISGMSTGLPTDIRFPFDRANLDDLILGKNFIKKDLKQPVVRCLIKMSNGFSKAPPAKWNFRSLITCLESLSSPVSLRTTSRL